MNAQQGGSDSRAIVVGVDGSELSRVALHWAAAEARLRGCSVHVVTVWRYDPGIAGWTAAVPPPIRTYEGMRDANEKVLAGAVAEVSGAYPDVSFRSELVEGWPPEVLSSAAAEAALLVLGHHGVGRLVEAVHGTVSGYCIRHTDCPVVVIPDVEAVQLHRPVPERAATEAP
ncbi:nucleotide-binding universal stress UspA family protein [Tamaricihabitans halophyticus]|uniref:Nucleotide-binding universal stress UspA family protein n=1 Tax=Tamaricihabitans halophyticus TaxID=1262583 RepID=A0A4R2R206_9PSEU|nr:universal stress protein [Tamaricihabitans halophyticus]TCP53501.1 nucleotide-binding universal stress UspA family protein [Tamaricihabitans halophyticus]